MEARYPGNWQEANESDARFAIKQAEEILDTVKTDFAIQGLTMV